MAGGPRRIDPFDVVTLAAVRRLIGRARFGGAVVLFTLVYIVGALFESGMFVLGNFGSGVTVEFLPASGTGQGWWNYPGAIVVFPWGVLSVPFFPTFAMLVVGLGVGIGMTVALLLTIRLVRPSASERSRQNAVGAVTGLTPAMISLVTLGACCSTTAAATAGVGLVADASATSVSNLLLNNWYLGVFQIAIVWVSLLAQELLLTVYTGLFGDRSVASFRAEPRTARAWATGAWRVLLLVGGILWSLGIALAWTTTDPFTASAVQWASWVLQYGVVGLFAVVLALVPRGTLARLNYVRGRWPTAVAPVLVGVGGASLLAVYPGLLASAGWASLPGELLGAWGVPPSWGAVTVPGASSVALLFRWTVEFGLLAVTSIVAALAPGRVARWFAPSAEPQDRPVGAGANSPLPGDGESDPTAPSPSEPRPA